MKKIFLLLLLLLQAESISAMEKESTSATYAGQPPLEINEALLENLCKTYSFYPTRYTFQEYHEQVALRARSYPQTPQINTYAITHNTAYGPYNFFYGHDRSLKNGDLRFIMIRDDKAIIERGDKAALDNNQAEILYLSHNGPILGIPQFSPDGMKVITVSTSEVKVWNGINGELLYTLPTRLLFTLPQFSSDGTKFFTSCLHRLYIWDANTGSLLQNIQESTVLIAKFIDNDSKLFTQSSYMQAKIWNTSTGELLLNLGSVHAQASPDGNQILTISLQSPIALRTRNFAEWKNGLGKLKLLLTTLRLDQAEIVRRAYESGKAGKVYEIDLQSEELIMLASIGRKKMLGTLQPRDDTFHELQAFLKNILHVRVYENTWGRENHINII